MNNLRIIYDNAANRAALAASSTVGSLVVANLTTDIKAQPWRSVGLSATLTATWTTAELIGCVALPFCNFTSTATIRVRGYTNVADTTPLFDTGTVLACAYQPLGMWDWGLQPFGVNAFSHGGGAYANVWIAQNWAKKLVIDLADSANTAGYIEASRLVIGSYWSPSINADYGAQITMVDSSKHQRNDAGDLMTDIGTRSRKISLNLTNMNATDRLRMTDIIRGNGMPQPLYFSLFPESDDSSLEQTYQIYCKLAAISAMAISFVSAYSAPIELEEI